MRVLALDVGSSSVKAGCWDGRAFAGVVRVAYRTRFEGVRAEIDPTTLWRAVMRAGKDALAGAGSGPFDAVAFSAFSSGVVVTDARGEPVLPIVTHADRRSIATAAELVRLRPKRWWLSRTGNLPYPGGIGSSTLAHHVHNQPDAFAPGYRVGQVSTLIGWWLTSGAQANGGQWTIDPSNAAFLGLYDIRRQRWSPEICQVIGIREDALPRVAPADSVIGALSAAVARRWGVPAGVPIVGGFIDTGGTLVQTPMRAGQLVHSVGSTDVLAMCTDAPAPAEGILTRPVGVGAALPERWLAVRTIASSGSAMQWVRETCFREVGNAVFARVLRRAAERVIAGGADLPDCAPTFVGERSQIEQPAGATFRRLRLGTTREEILAAVMKGLVAESRESYRRLAAIHKPVEQVYFSGGASALADAMHAAWPGRHRFERVPGETLRGLVILAERAAGKRG